MVFDNLPLIIAIEVAFALLVFCIVLIIRNRSSRRVTKKLQARMTQLVDDLRAARAVNKAHAEQPAAATEESAAAPSKSYLEFIEEALETTRNHHASLEPDRDIVLDLAPDTELPRRAAALRYAILLGEKEAVMAAEETEEPLDWSIIRSKYHQIFEFYEDYVPEPEQTSDTEELETLNQELTNAKKRINNLEKFKALYFDLEAQWENSKEEADVHYRDLSAMVSEVSDTEKFEKALEGYHAAYSSVGKMIDEGIGDNESQVAPGKEGDASAGELRHLRMVAADQHRIITELENKLKEAATDEDRNQIVDGLKSELDKQRRFMQESETCIQLMEDELNNAHREIDQLKGRLKTLPSLKTQLQENRKQKDEYELKVYALTSENRKLTKRLKEVGESSGRPMADDGEMKRLKKEITELETRYASLEEKYLDLKLNQ